jgi:hypothetical protein
MRVIGRLLETALVLTYIIGMWAARRRARRSNHRLAQRRLLEHHGGLEHHGPRRDTFASGYVGAPGWDGYVVPPAATPERPAKRVHRNRRHGENAELQRQARRRLTRASRPRRSVS